MLGKACNREGEQMIRHILRRRPQTRRKGWVALLATTPLAVAAALTFAVGAVGAGEGEINGDPASARPSPAWAASDEARFDAHMAAGEHHLAKQMADRASDPRQRDEWLSRLAENQADHGAFARSVETASYIQSDTSRSSTLSQLRNQPFGDDMAAGRGGGIVADFDSLIDLITNTVAVDSWDEVGGPGHIEPFRAGVHVDATGTLRKIDRTLSPSTLDYLRDTSSRRGENTEVATTSRLRKISLTRLEKEVQLRNALGLPPTDIMKNLAGLQKIQYIFVYPETGDIVIAGPASEWSYDGDGRPVGIESGQPTLQLDDLVVCLRNAYDGRGTFGCSIDPRPENLAATQRFLASSKLTGGRWRTELRNTLGLQDISIDGIDPKSHAARVLVEADYRMKLVGIGLEEGVLGLESYLDMVGLDEDGNPPSMDVVRWWFAMNYDALTTTEKRNAFEINGLGVQVMSETEFLARDGERVRSGKSTAPTARFAAGFTKEFEAMQAKYPIYAELRNVFDLALVASLIREEGLDDSIEWNLTHFGSASDNNVDVYQVEEAAVPRSVETVMNHRTIDSRKDGRRLRHTIIGVSGGVVADTRPLIQSDNIKLDSYGLMRVEQSTAEPTSLSHHQWWWD